MKLILLILLALAGTASAHMLSDIVNDAHRPAGGVVSCQNLNASMIFGDSAFQQKPLGPPHYSSDTISFVQGESGLTQNMSAWMSAKVKIISVLEDNATAKTMKVGS